MKKHTILILISCVLFLNTTNATKLKDSLHQENKYLDMPERCQKIIYNKFCGCSIQQDEPALLNDNDENSLNIVLGQPLTENNRTYDGSGLSTVGLCYSMAYLSSLLCETNKLLYVYSGEGGLTERYDSALVKSGFFKGEGENEKWYLDSTWFHAQEITQKMWIFFAIVSTTYCFRKNSISLLVNKRGLAMILYPIFIKLMEIYYPDVAAFSSMIPLPIMLADMSYNGGNVISKQFFEFVNKYPQNWKDQNTDNAVSGWMNFGYSLGTMTAYAFLFFVINDVMLIQNLSEDSFPNCNASTHYCPRNEKGFALFVDVMFLVITASALVKKFMNQQKLYSIPIFTFKEVALLSAGYLLNFQ